MQTITPALEAILKDAFQAGAQGYRQRVELDRVALVSTPSNVALGRAVTVEPLFANSSLCPIEGSTAAATNGALGDFTRIASHVGADGGVHGADWTLDLGVAYQVDSMRLKLIMGTGGGNELPDPTLGPTDTDLWRGILQASDDGTSWADVPVTYTTTGAGDTLWGVWTLVATATHRYWRVQARWTSPPGIHFITYCGFGEWEINGLSVATSATTVALPSPIHIGIDKSLRLASDQAEVVIPNEGLPLEWQADALPTNLRLRIWQWYGEDANEVRTFTGVVDRVHHSRDVLTVAITCRDMMAVLLDQTFSATAPQGATEVGAVRTRANGVYLNMEVADIVAAILDRASWPTADRAITPTSYVLDEFLIQDGASWADTIIGAEQPTGLVGYSAWCDEAGVFHFAPTAIAQNLTEPVAPVYTFEAGVDLISLDSDVDQYGLRTRVKARGPLTGRVLEDTWREQWRTRTFRRPVGLWHDPTDAAYLRVLDAATRRMYRLRQSDRVAVSSVNLASAVPSPLGLSGDPADATVYWVLNAPWRYGGGTSGNSVKKIRKSDNHVLATYSLPSGQWSAIKVSTGHLWLTRLDTDRFYQRSKADGSAVADFRHTYASVLQSNPSGVMVDGSNLYVFWSNGGTTARFLHCTTSAPGTVVGVVETVGTVLHGGEMDTVTHQHCYGDSDSLGLVAKFTLVNAVDQTTQVYAEVVDTALEDELGANAQLEAREHDTHPTDPDHPYEVRRLTLDLKVVTSLAQATETAQRQLELVSQRRRMVDAGVIGNPALQKTDPVAVSDPITGTAEAYVIDTYRTSMDAEGTYLGTVALLPVAAIEDDPTDEGDAT